MTFSSVVMESGDESVEVGTGLVEDKVCKQQDIPTVDQLADLEAV